jgi:hypothetical protein
MATSAAHSILKQSAREYDLLFPADGLHAPEFLLRETGSDDLAPNWRQRFEQLVSNEWSVAERMFFERPYTTVVELRNQLHHRCGRMVLQKEGLRQRVDKFEQIVAELEKAFDKHGPHETLRTVIGEASPRSNAAKMGWSQSADSTTYILGFMVDSDIDGESRARTRYEFQTTATLELARERMREYQSVLAQKHRKADRSLQLCRFKLQIHEAMLWQYEMFGELEGLTPEDIEKAADQYEKQELSEKNEGCNVPALRTAWEWMLRNRKRCWDATGLPNKRAIWQTILLDPEHRDSLWMIDSESTDAERISVETADHYMERFEVEVGPGGLQEFQRSLGFSAH